MILQAIGAGLGLGVAVQIVNRDRNKVNAYEEALRRRLIKTELEEIAVAKELLKAYGYDKPRG